MYLAHYHQSEIAQAKWPSHWKEKPSLYKSTSRSIFNLFVEGNFLTSIHGAYTKEHFGYKQYVEGWLYKILLSNTLKDEHKGNVKIT